MNQSDNTRFDRLVEWSRQHGAHLHPSLEIYHDHLSKYSLRVKADSHGLDAGFTAATCPLSTTLSFLNALIDGPIDLSSPPSSQKTGALPPRFTQSVPPHVLGRFFLIKEYLKGRDSHWWPYIATLPAPEQVTAWALPAFWPDDDIAYLEGTNAHVAIEEIQANVKREFKQARKLLKDENFPAVADYTQLLYKWAFSIFTSRSFRPSLILSDAAKHHITATGLLPLGCQLDDFSILQPLFDVANHSMTARYTWDTTTITFGLSSCALICRDPYPPGAQVYNNYGLKTNSELLLGYGFVLPETEALHNDYVHVRKRGQQQQQEEEGNGETGKATDFLISLRPFADASSLVARSRLSVAPPQSRLASLPCFAHFEPALVEDLAGAVATPEEREALGRWKGDGERDDSHVVPPELGELVEKVRGVLKGKLQWDYQRLKAVEGGGDGDDEGEEGEGGLPPPGNRNQALAAEYRAQCGKVLIAALEGLMGEDADGGEDEHGLS